LALPCSVFAADVALYVAGKGQSFYQTDVEAIFPDPAEPYAFFASVESTGPNAVSGVDLLSPSGEFATMTPDGESLYFEATFPTKGIMDATVPDDAENPYTMTIHSVNDGDVVTHLYLRGASYPPAPRLVNYAAAQAADPDLPFVLQWNTFTDGTTDDLILVRIMWNDEDVWETGTPGEPNVVDGTQTSVTVPETVLEPGRIYEVEIEFIRMADLNTTDYPGATGFAVYYSSTSTQMQTTGLPERPQRAELYFDVREHSVILDDPLTGPVNAWFPSTPDWGYDLEFQALDVLGLPLSVNVSTPMPPPLQDIPFTGYSDYGGPNSRLYYSDNFPSAPPWPIGGTYTVDYDGIDVLFELDPPNLEQDVVRVVPQVTLDENGAFQALQWIYHNAAGEVTSLPNRYAFLILDIVIIDAPWESFLDLPVDSTSLTLPSALSWTNVSSLIFRLRDDQGHWFSSQSDRHESVYVPANLRDLPVATVGETYSVQLEVAGGRPPFLWELYDSWARPEWLSISPQGLVSGVPTAPGDSYFIVKVSDAHPSVQNLRYDIRVAPSSDQPDFPTWLARYFDEPDLSNPDVVGTNSDPEGDGHPNALEFAYATDPSDADALANALTVHVAGDSYVITHAENVMATGLTLNLQVLTSWGPPVVWSNLTDVVEPGSLQTQLLPQDHAERRWRETSIQRAGLPGQALLRLAVEVQ
jgi:hypothetical protein